MIRPWSENVWFSPCYVINELSKAAVARKNLKRYKEAWICAVALICHSAVESVEWWIQLPKKDPPDVLAMNFVPREDGKGQNLVLMNFEVFEISEFDNEDIEKSIEKKLNQKDYSGMTLIAFVRRKGIFDHEKVSEYIKKIYPKILGLFLLVFEQGGTNVSFIQVFPECFKFKADFGHYCKTTTQREFTRLSRSTIIKKDDVTTNDTLTLVP